MGRKRPHHGSRRRGRTGGARTRARTLTGELVVSLPGVAHVETAEGDFELVRHGQREAMNGDVVEVALVEMRGRAPRAVVRSVIERSVETFLGSFSWAGPLGAVTPLDARLGRDFFVVPEDPSPSRLGVREGDVVVARISEYPTRRSSAVVTIERRVGARDEVDLNVESVVATFGLPGDFSRSVLEQAAAIELGVERALVADASRRDLRGRLCVTVDPVDARDFDDAVGARRLEGGGYELDVHIADVTHYVSPDSPVDNEAKRRTCSAYLVDRVIPMLPEHLSNEVCSLVPGEDRLAMSVLMRLDERGRVRGFSATPSAIRSAARLDYDAVDAVLSGASRPEELPCAPGDVERVFLMLETLDEIRGLRELERRSRGAIDFESVEARVRLDEEGRPTGVSVRRRTRATGLIEEAMLLANECVAQLLERSGAPAAFRVHEPPLEEDLRSCVQPLRELGLLDGAATSELLSGSPFAIRGVLERARGTDAAQAASALLLRAQRRAVYLPFNEGHYALGATAYCHFTSPIRRYPDVLVHRALKAALAGRPDGPEMRRQAAALPQLCRTCSERERAADAAGRMSQRVKMAELYLGLVGQRASGTVSGCAGYGVFVTLDETCAEGLVPVRSLGDEWFTFDDGRMTLTGEETGEVWRLGRRVVVEVASANPARGQIDFSLAPSGRSQGAPSSTR
ncbi:ribonuclease R family protein [Thermophilibacter mediterraneus]|uniref:ribonuclease R family protein n=1 Tax=Thermophilibacter mediterraneus TaxID=1871031 RepID=UPI00235543AA|nr:VacB/RNase II family 3'-5' exoribonuclease [Thermophilibacter mediterraneus]